MDKVLTTTLLTIAAVIAAVLVINTMLPVLGSSGSSVISSSEAASDLLKTDIDIIHVSTATTTPANIYVWIKNVGAADVLAVNQSDVFLQIGTTSFDRVEYDETASTTDCSASAVTGKWRYCIEESETTWKPGNTLKITITLASLAEGDYLVRYSTRNGVTDEKSFTV